METPGNIQQAEKIEEAIKNNELSLYKERPVGSAAELSRISGTKHGTISYACRTGRVRLRKTEGWTLYVDALDLVDYLRASRRGRKPLAQI